MVHERSQTHDAAESSGGGAGGRAYTVSLAVSSSCVDNAQNLELATALAGQIARAATVFNVDEVVVIDDSGAPQGQVGKGAALLARVLQYLETPQYLRKALLPMHADLRLVGMLPPLDAPHHRRADEWSAFREGVVTRASGAGGSFADIGLDREAHFEAAVRVGQRVTLDLGTRPQLEAVAGAGQVYAAQLCLPSTPREAAGLYWGYSTRVAAGLADALAGCPFPGGAYDLKLGTSERGVSVVGGEHGGGGAKGAHYSLPPFRHLLVVFGGPEGLEACASRDPACASRDPACGGGGGASASGVPALFDQYINTCPRQGSRTIRTEEAILISMAVLQQPIHTAGAQGQQQQ